MLRWALMFFVVALIAGVLGFFVIAGAFAVVAQWLFVLFLIASLVSVLTRRRVVNG